jgi:hypothetical protein
MISPLIIHGGNHCPVCGKDYVSLYDVNGRRIPYYDHSYDLDKLLNREDSKTMAYMKCSSCGTKFFIDYGLGYARPVTAEFIRENFFGIFR